MCGHQAGKPTCMQDGKLVGRQAGRQAGRWAGRLGGGGAGRKAGRQKNFGVLLERVRFTF